MRTWRATWGDESLTVAEVTGGEAVAIEALCGVPFAHAEPLASATVLVSILTVLAARAAPSLEDAAREVHVTALADLLGMIEVIDGDDD